MKSGENKESGKKKFPTLPECQNTGTEPNCWYFDLIDAV
jgi:hypothetical protein